MQMIRLFYRTLLFVIAALNTLQAQQIPHYNKETVYTENKGQWPKEVLYLCQSNGLDMWITQNGIVYNTFQDESAPGKAAKKTRERINKPMDYNEIKRKGHIIKLGFAQKNQQSVYSGQKPIDGITNYFIGNNPSQWTTNVRSYRSISGKNIGRNMDISYYIQDNKPRYDLILHPGSNPEEIQMNIEGAIAIQTAPDGTALVIRTTVGDLIQGNLFAYQMEDEQIKQVPCFFQVDKQGKVGFKVEKYDKSKPLIIDPLVYCTYYGGTGDDIGKDIAIDNNGDIYITGTTNNSSFPTSSGAYQTTVQGANDIFVVKMNSTATSRIYSTLIGGTGNDTPNSIAVDASGNAYITGNTASTNYPTTGGAFQTTNAGSFDVIVTKLNSTGTALSYSTYIGGTGSDNAFRIRLDNSGNAYIGGRTASTNYDVVGGGFQTTNGGSGDGFITKLNSTGTSLVFSTYIGGTGDDNVNDLVLDAAGNIYFTGLAGNATFDVISGSYDVSYNGAFLLGDAFVTKMNSTGTALTYSTFIGGSDDDIGVRIALDEATGTVYVAVSTYSGDFPTTASAFQTTNTGAGSSTDIAIVKLNSAGNALVYSTYLGGSDFDSPEDIAVNSSGQAIVVGSAGPGFDIAGSAHQSTFGGDFTDAFFTQLNATGTALVYSTYKGGSAGESLTGIALDAQEHAWCVGYTSSNNIGTSGGPYQSSIGGASDVFIIKEAIGISSSITLTAPDGGETYCAGNSATITWSSTGITNIKIELSTNGGSTWPTTIIASTSASAGSYAWNIPSAQAAGTTYKVRLSDASNATINDISTNNFTINTRAVFSFTFPSFILVPPNQTNRLNFVSISMTGGCTPSWVLKSINSSEPDASAFPTDVASDITGASYGSADLSFLLRAERIPGGPGRTYTITYTLTDNGAQRDTSFYILVPGNQGMAIGAATGTCATMVLNSAHVYTGSGSINFTANVNSAAQLKVRIFSNRGKDIRWIANGNYAIGSHSLTWNGKDRNGADVPNGSYFVQLQADCGNTAAIPIIIQRP
jgi:hypothetical protein